VDVRAAHQTEQIDRRHQTSWAVSLE